MVGHTGRFSFCRATEDTLLLLNGILMPFAMNVLQFSDVFLMKTEFDDHCHDCLERRHPWIGYLWAYLVGLLCSRLCLA